VFEDAANIFEGHKESISMVIRLLVGKQVARMSNTLDSITMDLHKLMVFAFEHMRTPEESQFLNFIKSHGGREEVLKKDELLKELLSKQRLPADDKAKRSGVKTSWVQPTADLKDELKREVTWVSDEEKSFFDKKFASMQSEIRQLGGEVKELVAHESDRVIGAVTTGPHERLKDPVSFV
jgi:hypothetical protein